MNTEDKINELFAEKLGQLETPVNPQLWNAIASQIGGSAVAASVGTGISVAAKIAIGVAAAAIVGVGAYFVANNQDTSENKKPVSLVANQQVESSTDEQQVKATSVSNSEKILLQPTNTQKAQEDKAITFTNQKKTENIAVVARTEPTTAAIPFERKAPIQERAFIPSETREETAVIARKIDAQKVEEKMDVQVAENVRKPLDSKASFELTKLPNVYVLNASGYFSIGYKGEYDDFQFTLMDSRNRTVFSSDHPNFEWRGIDVSNTQVEPGNYVYIITAKDKNGISVNKFSPLTIINQ